MLTVLYGKQLRTRWSRFAANKIISKTGFTKLDSAAPNNRMHPTPATKPLIQIEQAARVLPNAFDRYWQLDEEKVRV